MVDHAWALNLKADVVRLLRENGKINQANLVNGSNLGDEILDRLNKGLELKQFVPERIKDISIAGGHDISSDAFKAIQPIGDYAETQFKPLYAQEKEKSLIPQQVVQPPPQEPVTDQSALIQEEAAKRSQAALQQRLDDIFGRVTDTGIQKINEQFIPARQKLISEEAALGRLRSPVSIIPLSNLEQQKQNAMSNLFGNIASTRASGELDTSKAIENILQAQRDSEERARQFNSDLGLRRDTLNSSINQSNLDRALKEQLGIGENAAKTTNPNANNQSSQADDISKYMNMIFGTVAAGKNAFGTRARGTKEGESGVFY